MTSIKRRIPPTQDAAEHAAKASDKTGKLEVKFINPYKGRGVFATTLFNKGDFVVEYRGELIHYEEAQRRRTLYHSACAVFMFDFLWQERCWCIDASREDNTLGRLVNDDDINPNCRIKKILVDGKPHLCLFAIRDINPGEEITYNYGGTDWPWTKKVDKESPVTESVEVENAGSSDQAPPKSSKKKVDKESPVTESVEVENAGSSDQAPPRKRSSKKKVDKESPVTESVEVENAGSSDQAPPRKRSSKKKVDKESPVTESVEVENAGSSDQAPPRKRSSKKKVDKESPVTESVEVENAGSSDQAPPKSSKKKVDKESPVTESVEVENAGSSDQAPPKSSKKKVDKESPVTESVEVENAGSSDQAPPRKRSSKKKVDKESPVTESVEVENAGSSDQAPPKSSKKKVDKESPVTESVEVENAGSSDQAPPKSSKKKVDKESPVTESVEVENAGSSDQAPPKSSKKKVDKESPVIESVEVENAGSSDQAPPRKRSSKKKVDKESPVTESVEVENAGSSDQAPPKSSKKKVDKESPVTESVEVENAGSSDQAPPRKRSSKKKVDKESPVTESVEVENAGSSDQAPPRKRSSKKKVDKESPVTESVEVENAGSSDQAPPRKRSSKKKVDKESPVTESVEVENAGSSDQAPPRKRSSKKKVDKESPVTESVEVENAGSSDQAPPRKRSSKKKVDKESPVTESVEVENAGSSDQAPPRKRSSKKKVDKESPVTESVEVENAGSSDQAPPKSSKKKVDKESPVTESVEVENAGSSDQAPPKSSKKKVDKESPVTESVEVENAGSSDQAPPRKRSSKKKVDKESPVTESVEVENAGSSDQAPPKSSKKKVDKESPVTESVEVENAGSSDQAPPRKRSSKKKVDKESPVTESVEVENAGSSDQAPPKSSKKKVDKESPVIESVEVENAGSSDQAPPRKRSSKKKVDKESPVTESVEVENAGSSDQAPPKSSKKKVDKESPVTESVEVENAGSSDQAPPRKRSSKKKVDKESPVTESVEVENAGSSDQAPPRKRSSKKKKHCSRSSPDSSSSYDDHLPIPKLRRTKSIFMNKLDPFESDDLFDPSSNDSEEEYVPKSGEEYSEDTDTSDIMEPDDLKSILFSRFNKTGEFPVGCTPVIEQNNNKSSEQGLHRGRSPTKKHKKFPKYKRRHFSPSLCRTKCIGEAQSAEVETGSSSEKDSSATSGPVAEDHGPSGSYSSVESDGLPKVSAFIPAVGKSSDGSRIYNKKQYCLYCKKGFIKIARHLERAHHNKPEVAQAIAFAKGSRERRLHLEHLRNRGNFTHNVEVLNSGAGTLVPRKQPRTISEPQNYLHCTYCQGLFTKKVLWRHMVICKFKPNVDKKPGRTRVQALCAFAVPPPPGVKTEFWKLLNTMNQDEVYTAVKSDELIKEYGQHLYNRLGHDASRHEYIRQKMRELGRLLIHSRKTTPMKTIEEHIKPANFMLVVESVKNLAGFSVETNTYKCPSLALKIGYSLTKISQLVESRANVQKNYSAAKDARAFRNVYESRWNEFVSAASLRTLQESKWNAPQLLPFTKDVQTLHSYLSEQQQHFYTELSAEASPQTWTNLAKVTLTQVILFNRRRSGEVSKMPLSAYLSSNPSSDQDDLKEALSDLEKKLCEHFRRLEIRGKRGRKVPVLLSPEMQQSLDMLVSKRQECGIPKENAHLFARPSAMSHYRGSDCLRHFASTCGAKRPDTLTSTKLRKQTATLSQILNLSNTELDQLANFLGHDIRVHRQFYRLPEGTLQLAKISKVLMALEQGRLAEFKGKSLDDITIDPEENVKLDSEEEAEIESDPKEDQVASIGHQILDVDNRNAETQDTRTLSQTCKSKSPKKGKSRQPCKRRTWEKAEVLAVEKHLMPFINTCRVPGKTDCENCLKQEPVALRHRNWLAIKFYVKNRITALKNKV